MRRFFFKVIILCMIIKVFAKLDLINLIRENNKRILLKYSIDFFYYQIKRKLFIKINTYPSKSSCFMRLTYLNILIEKIMHNSNKFREDFRPFKELNFASLGLSFHIIAHELLAQCKT